MGWWDVSGCVFSVVLSEPRYGEFQSNAREPSLSFSIKNQRLRNPVWLSTMLPLEYFWKLFVTGAHLPGQPRYWFLRMFPSFLKCNETLFASHLKPNSHWDDQETYLWYVVVTSVVFFSSSNKKWDLVHKNCCQEPIIHSTRKAFASKLHYFSNC